MEREEIARKTSTTLWVDYCDCDCDKADEMESVIGWNTYDAIRYKPFEVISMLLKVIDGKDKEIQSLDESLKNTCDELATYRNVLSVINKRTGQVLNEI